MDTALRLIVVGGVAGGATAAARARRLSESAEIIVFERGAYVSFANCGLPYYVGREIAERESLLLETPESLHARYGSLAERLAFASPFPLSQECASEIISGLRSRMMLA